MYGHIPVAPRFLIGTFGGRPARTSSETPAPTVGIRSEARSPLPALRPTTTSHGFSPQPATSRLASPLHFPQLMQSDGWLGFVQEDATQLNWMLGWFTGLLVPTSSLSRSTQLQSRSPTIRHDPITSRPRLPPSVQIPEDESRGISSGAHVRHSARSGESVPMVHRCRYGRVVQGSRVCVLSKGFRQLPSLKRRRTSSSSYG